MPSLGPCALQVQQRQGFGRGRLGLLRQRHLASPLSKITVPPDCFFRPFLLPFVCWIRTKLTKSQAFISSIMLSAKGGNYFFEVKVAASSMVIRNGQISLKNWDHGKRNIKDPFCSCFQFFLREFPLLKQTSTVTNY